MKKIIFLFSVFLVSFSATAQLAIRYTPFVFLRNMKYTVHAEYMIPRSPRISIALGFSQNIDSKIDIWNDEENKMGKETYFELNKENSTAGFSFDPELRIYDGLTEKNDYSGNMEGLYWGFYSSQRFSVSKWKEYSDYIPDPNSIYPSTDSIFVDPTGGIQNDKTYVAVYGIQAGLQFPLRDLNPFLDERLLFDLSIGGGIKFITHTFEAGNNQLIGGMENSFKKDIALRANISILWKFKRRAK
jgi:hypothetical protein